MRADGLSGDEDELIVIEGMPGPIPVDSTGDLPLGMLPTGKPRGRPRKDGRPPVQRPKLPPGATAGELADVDCPRGAKARIRERETRGMDLRSIAEYAIFPAFILNQMREVNFITRKVSKLKLFGKDAKLNQESDDELLVRIFREQGKLYRNAVERDDAKAAQEALNSIMKLNLGVMAKSESLLGMAIKVQSDAAKLQDRKRRGDEAVTEADLIEAAGEE
jgi:hypothetical protein